MTDEIDIKIDESYREIKNRRKEYGRKENVFFGSYPETSKPWEILEEFGLRIATPYDYVCRGIGAALFDQCVVIIPPKKNGKYKIVFLREPPIKGLLSKNGPLEAEMPIKCFKKSNDKFHTVGLYAGDGDTRIGEEDFHGNLEYSEHTEEVELNEQREFLFSAIYNSNFRKDDFLANFLFPELCYCRDYETINDFEKRFHEMAEIKLSIPHIDPEIKYPYIRPLYAADKCSFYAVENLRAPESHEWDRQGLIKEKRIMFVPEDNRKGKMRSTYFNLYELSEALKSGSIGGLEEGILKALGFDGM